jgi:hypothetical protein
MKSSSTTIETPRTSSLLQSPRPTWRGLCNFGNTCYSSSISSSNNNADEDVDEDGNERKLEEDADNNGGGTYSSTKPAVIIGASMDNTSMFHDLAPGANEGASNILTLIMAACLLVLSMTDATLDASAFVERPEERYQVVVKERKQIIVRNIEGYISKMPRNTSSPRENNLTRAPDGNRESRVLLATFPVGHYINHRTVRLNNESSCYVFTFVGDEQATPHFMRYSGLIGACINSMLFNNIIKSAVKGDTFQHRFQVYANETDWCNGEVVTRGIGSNYGRDGFLRPGFEYAHGLDYLRSRVIEWMEANQDLDDILSRDWKNKFASSKLNEECCSWERRLPMIHKWESFLGKQ